MRISDILAVAVTAFFGAVTGWLISGTTGAAVVAAVAATLAFGGVRARIRPGIVSIVLVGTMAGGLIGSGIVEAVCRPSSCRAFEIVGGLVTAGLSLVGIGLVAALVTRSFDEYNEQMKAGLPPAGAGLESEEQQQTADD